MRVWRLCRRAHGAFDGEGARRFGGRWSLRGTPVVYTSASAALATLEYFVHLDVEDAPPDLVLIAADTPIAACSPNRRATSPIVTSPSAPPSMMHAERTEMTVARSADATCSLVQAA